ncbi:hypothetical protein [Paracoccus alkenifer]|uniref:Excalibur calcium-binding domain-containing protein n=1 Tax=Paracoccus alkenifer TaxID=65735 RepID=A0A1H6JJV8_9RHOB|nr:hypothetical protein [Paracoccus alkenifer]SEH59428.1 hypothetical protein SAMN04488075_0256 [Paracoccus alkenifer]
MRAKTLFPAATIALVALAGCSENSGWNPNYQAGSSNYGNYLRAREMALTGRTDAPPQVVPVAMPSRAPTPQQIAGAPVARVAADGTQPRRAQLRRAPAVDPLPEGAVIVTPRSAPAPASAPQTASRRAAPAAPAAVTATVLPGTVKPLYARSQNVVGDCTEYATPQAAQAEFIARGGPKRDPLGLDPDGDGNACTYRPGI